MARIQFIGNLGKDAELRYTPSGQPVLNFSVADSKSKRLESGEWETVAEQWLNCSIWGPFAEAMRDELKKGTRVNVSGEFYARPYQGKDGTPGMSLDVRVEAVGVVQPRNQQQGMATSTGRLQGQPQQGYQQSDPWAAPQGGQQGFGIQQSAEPPF